MSKRLILLLTLGLIGCEDIETQRKRQAKEAWEGTCVDSATLLATTSGSPNDTTCPNKRHRMRVQVASKATNEEAAALVFCECERLPVPEAK